MLLLLLEWLKNGFSIYWILLFGSPEKFLDQSEAIVDQSYEWVFLRCLDFLLKTLQNGIVGSSLRLYQNKLITSKLIQNNQEQLSANVDQLKELLMVLIQQMSHIGLVQVHLTHFISVI